MPNRELTSLPSLYHDDETAWLERMAQLIAERRLDELDHDHLREFLLDMARRDRREVKQRLTRLLMHLLKWEHQPDQRSASWEVTIRQQRDELEDLLESGTLRRHATEVLAKAYGRARELAALETGLEAGAFPETCPMTIGELLAR